jgi:hypothetical protein
VSVTPNTPPNDSDHRGRAGDVDFKKDAVAASGASVGSSIDEEDDMDSERVREFPEPSFRVDMVAIKRCENGFIVEREVNPRSAALSCQVAVTLDDCMEIVRSLLSK